LAELRAEIEKYDSKMEDLHTENLYLESYSRRENIKFMNINEEPSTNGNENREDILRNFLTVSWREILASSTQEALKSNAFTALGREERTSLVLFWLDSSVTKIAKKFFPLATDFKELTTRCSEISPTR